eukprot:jgi/Galph1/1673/GphlegSOOS_G336.1
MYELERAVFQELYRRIIDNEYQTTEQERKALVDCDNNIVGRGLFSALTTFSLTYYGLKQLSRRNTNMPFLRVRPVLPSILFGLTSGFYFAKTAAPSCVQHLLNTPDSPISEEIKIIMREFYEQTPSSVTGQAIVSRYGYLLGPIEHNTSTIWEDSPNSDIGDFGKTEGDWQDLGVSKTQEISIPKRVGPRRGKEE